MKHLRCGSLTSSCRKHGSTFSAVPIWLAVLARYVAFIRNHACVLGVVATLDEVRLRTLVLKRPRAIRSECFLNDLTCVLEASMVALTVGKYLRKVTHPTHLVQLFHVLTHAILDGVLLRPRVHRCLVRNLMINAFLTHSLCKALSSLLLPVICFTAVSSQ